MWKIKVGFHASYLLLIIIVKIEIALMCGSISLLTDIPGGYIHISYLDLFPQVHTPCCIVLRSRVDAAATTKLGVKAAVHSTRRASSISCGSLPCWFLKSQVGGTDTRRAYRCKPSKKYIAFLIYRDIFSPENWEITVHTSPVKERPMKFPFWVHSRNKMSALPFVLCSISYCIQPRCTESLR